jgi:hypothetical protein
MSHDWGEPHRCASSLDLITTTNNTNMAAVRTSGVSEISGSHDGEYEHGCLLGCCVLIALMMEAANTSETSVNFYQTTTTQKTAIF